MSGPYVSLGIAVTFSTLAAELVDVKINGEKCDTVDVSSQEDMWRRFLAGLADGGDVTLTVSFDPDAAVPATGTSDTLGIAWPTGATKEYSASAILNSKGVTGSLGQKLTQDLGFKISGEPNWAAGGT